MQKQAPYFEKASDQNLFLLTPPVIPNDIPYTMELESAYNGYNLYIKAQDGDVTTKLSIYNYHRFLGKFGVKSFRALRQLITEKYPTASDLQHLCSDLFSGQIEFNVDFIQQTGDDDEDDDY